MILAPRRSLILPSRFRQTQGGFILNPYILTPPGGGGAWVTTYGGTTGTNSPGWGGYTMRQTIPASALVAGSKIRLTFAAATSGANLVIAKAYVQLAAGSGDPYDFASAPVQLLFGGAAGVTVPTNSTVTTDEATLAIPAGTPVVVSLYITSGDLFRYAQAGWTGYYKLGDDAATVDASGYSGAADQNYAVKTVEVFPGGGGGPPAQYWDAAKKDVNATLSEANDRLMSVAISSWRGALSVTGHDSGFYYAEIVKASANAAWSGTFGAGTSATATNNFGGSSAASACVQTDDGGQSRVLKNAVQVGTKLTSIALDDYVRVAYKGASGELWLGTPAAWFGGGDPAAGTSPTTTFTAGTTLYLVGICYQDSARARTALADFAGVVPTGASAWG